VISPVNRGYRIRDETMLKHCMVVLAVACTALCARADSTIHESNKWAYAANAGWLNCRTDETNGAAIGQFICAGYFYSPSIGWINLGDGTPTNGIQYSNAAADDFGVNHDGMGNLRGYAWGEGAGWIVFEKLGAAKIDLLSGMVSGLAWGEAVGWVSFTNVSVYLQSIAFDAGPDEDGDGIPDRWERARTGATNIVKSGADTDGDGVADEDEYMADTDPTDAGEFFEIKDFSITNGSNGMVTWASRETRIYAVQTNVDVTLTGGWISAGEPPVQLPDAGATTTREFSDVDKAKGVCRVKVLLPLSQ